MLLDSTTYPLPAQRPWSAGSISALSVLVLCSALSTAFNPLTPVAPPEVGLIRSQPGPIVWQLTVGGAGSGPLRGRTGDGSARGVEGKLADSAGELVVAELLEA